MAAAEQTSAETSVAVASLVAQMDLNLPGWSE